MTQHTAAESSEGILRCAECRLAMRMLLYKSIAVAFAAGLGSSVLVQVSLHLSVV